MFFSKSSESSFPVLPLLRNYCQDIITKPKVIMVRSEVIIYNFTGLHLINNHFSMRTLINHP